jgi:hypothetical protein
MAQDSSIGPVDNGLVGRAKARPFTFTRIVAAASTSGFSRLSSFHTRLQ